MTGNQRKAKTKTTKRTTTTYRRSSYRSPVRHKRPGFFIRFLQKMPSWTWWLGGGLVVFVYIWAFYFFFVGPTGFRWRALYGDVDYPEGYEIHGIDISHYQGTIDWEKVKDAMIDNCPVRFVVIKATEGTTSLDDNFNDNFYQSKEYGFIRGAYHFWSTKSSARDQAAYFLKQVHLEDGDLPPVLDIEHKSKDQTNEQFKESVLTWLHIVEDKYHVKPIIYTYYKFKMTYLDDPVFDQYPYWIAHYYVQKVQYEGRWKFWQHTDCGKLPGIKGYIDFDIYNGSFYDLRKLTIGSHEQIGEDAYQN
jgi:lysozyme